MSYQSCWPRRLVYNRPFSRYTTFKIGGPAEFWFTPKDTEDLRAIIKSAREKGIPVFVIGAGSNILAADEGIKGLIISLSGNSFKKIEISAAKVFCGAGVRLAFLINRLAQQNLGGLEFLSGIPGTIGGAVAMNAGTRSGIKNEKLKMKNRKTKTKSIGDLVESVTVMDYNGNVKVINKRNLDFGYRSSNLSGRIILGVTLRLIRKDKERINQDIKGYILLRKKTQDLSYPSAGCIFKNPDADSAGRLIDLCGLKGKSIAGAFISQKHGNFILNKGNARAKDVLGLMDLARLEVKKKFNVDLIPEIKIWK